MAAGFMRERTDHTLQPSALVNEAVIRLLDGGGLVKAQDRATSSPPPPRPCDRPWSTTPAPACAASGGWRSGAGAVGRRARLLRVQHLDVIALHEAIDRLIALDERQGLVVTLRFFAGLSISEVAKRLDVSAATVEGDWRVARAWLRGQLGRLGVRPPWGRLGPPWGLGGLSAIPSFKLT